MKKSKVILFFVLISAFLVSFIFVPNVNAMICGCDGPFSMMQCLKSCWNIGENCQSYQIHGGLCVGYTGICAQVVESTCSPSGVTHSIGVYEVCFSVCPPAV